MFKSKQSQNTKGICLAALLVLLSWVAQSQTMDEMWDTASNKAHHPNVQWFKEAKFGLFIHWGLYSKLAGTWKGKRYYGSGEWIMNVAKIPVKEYEKIAADFNPVNFNATQWARLAKEAGVKYMVITAKHHEGFAMYDSKVSDYTIVRASPYKKDPMKALSDAVRKEGIHFGFYYSQFVDWHDPNGGKNTWDFTESKKNYQLYYQQKAIPQLKELLTNYGPLGIVWFDLPGGLTKQETRALVDTLHALQPKSLFSSRVGKGLGDYKDFGDSEIPPAPINDVWESIYTHNDSWGYIEHDMNFKSSKELIQLLATVSSKGGNLMLNVGPDGNGNIPPYSIKFLKETGKWLDQNGESIYGTDFGFVPAQPWGVTTAKDHRLFLHVFHGPANGKVWVPDFVNAVKKVYLLADKKALKWVKQGADLLITLPTTTHPASTVIVVEFTGKGPAYDSFAPTTISSQYATNTIEAINAITAGETAVKKITFSHYFGDWKHVTCITDMKAPTDAANFNVRVVEPGDYKLILEYACEEGSAKQEGRVTVNGKEYLFKTLHTSEYNKSAPLLFIKHSIAIASFSAPGQYSITVQPLQQGKELFKLKSIYLEPLH